MNAFRHNSGFTLIELVMVIVLAGVLAAIAIPKFFDPGVFNNNGFRDQVIASLRYAQKAAIAQHGFVCVAFTSNAVSLTTGASAACGTLLANPSGNGGYLVQSGQSSFSPVPGNFSFDWMGIPRSPGMGTNSDTVGVLTAAQTVSIKGAAAVITIEQETGFVH